MERSRVELIAQIHWHAEWSIALPAVFKTPVPFLFHHRAKFLADVADPLESAAEMGHTTRRGRHPTITGMRATLRAGGRIYSDQWLEIGRVGDAMSSKRWGVKPLLGVGKKTLRDAGFSVLEANRAEWASIPIVVLSGFGELLNPDVVTRLGVREVLQKPLLGTAIVSAVRKAIAS